jgi:hypothetical protein
MNPSNAPPAQAVQGVGDPPHLGKPAFAKAQNGRRRGGGAQRPAAAAENLLHFADPGMPPLARLAARPSKGKADPRPMADAGGELRRAPLGPDGASRPPEARAFGAVLPDPHHNALARRSAGKGQRKLHLGGVERSPGDETRQGEPDRCGDPPAVEREREQQPTPARVLFRHVGETGVELEQISRLLRPPLLREHHGRRRQAYALDDSSAAADDIQSSCMLASSLHRPPVVRYNVCHEWADGQAVKYGRHGRGSATGQRHPMRAMVMQDSRRRSGAVGGGDDQAGPVVRGLRQRKHDRPVQGDHLPGQACGQVDQLGPHAGIREPGVDGEAQPQPVGIAVAVRILEDGCGGKERPDTEGVA